MSRYARQMILPEVGVNGQGKLSRAHALVIGAGGLGAPVLSYLAGAGVGRITIVDPDIVDVTNLHRQVIFAESQIAQAKADVAAAVVAGLNRDVTVVPVAAAFTPANAVDLIRGADIVLDCADSFAASYTASDTCLDLGTPLISASALGMAGYVGGFCAGAPSLRAVFPDLPDNTASCATAGVLGPVVGVVGAMQAQMALAVLLGLAPSPMGQLVRYDARTIRTSLFRFDAAPEPEFAFRFIAPSDIHSDDFVAELRPVAEAAVPAAPHAIRIDETAFGPNGPEPAPGQRAVMCCRSGLRSWRAANRLRTVWDGEIVLTAFGNT